MIFKNIRVYPIQLINELGQSIVVQPMSVCELPQEIGFRYNSVLEPVYMELPETQKNDVFVIEQIPSIDESLYIDESHVELSETKKKRGRPKKG